MFIDSLDIANRSARHCGVPPIQSVTEDSQRNREISAVYDTERRAEMRRNVWRFAVRFTALRPLSDTTLQLVPADYSASKTYLPGEVVKDTNGCFWISMVAGNFGNSPGGNNEMWESYFGSPNADIWNAATTYYVGEIVYLSVAGSPGGYQVFMSLKNNNSDTPTSATPWDTTVQYKQGDVISYSAQKWASQLPRNVGNTPATGPLAWASATAYVLGDQVTGSDGYIYAASTSTTGNDPSTDAGVHWTNSGLLNAWSVVTAPTSAVSWRPISATLRNVNAMYPIGAGPVSQTTTRNVYPLPCGYLRMAPQHPNAGAITALGGPSGNVISDWELDGNYIVTCDNGVVVLRFVADITTVRLMDDMFCEGLAARIATAVCPTLTQSDGKLQTIASAYKTFMGDARQVNAIEEGPVEMPEDAYISVRA